MGADSSRTGNCKSAGKVLRHQVSLKHQGVMARPGEQATPQELARPEPPELFLMPLCNMEQFCAAEAQLKNFTNRTLLEEQVVSLGDSKNLQNVVREMVGRLFSEQVQEQFSLLGYKGESRFKDAMMCKKFPSSTRARASSSFGGSSKGASPAAEPAVRSSEPASQPRLAEPPSMRTAQRPPPSKPCDPAKPTDDSSSRPLLVSSKRNQRNRFESVFGRLRIKEAKASCELVGHHFSTFDGREFDYSYCHHILLQDVVGGNLTISVDRHCSLENQESCPKRVIVEHGHHRIVLDADLSATVDGDEYSAHQLQLLTKRLPDFELERVGERIHFRSRVHSLVLKLDLRGRVEVEVDSSLKGVLGGLCGFYNELVSDDLTTPAGHQVATTDEFGDSWATPGTAQDCLPLACPRDTLLQAAKICNRLKEEPLSQCQGIEDQLANCLSATCECLQRGNTTAESCACDAYLDAVTQCEKDGGEKAVGESARVEAGVRLR
ncbi:hypothetical protein HPB47_016697 [Ixodes persulcatus]|uniref:Uncharacterized protein n=1 Tax=Ixodes persulcatus TaxID=34615 RepID=A0AC60QQ76_IXOPE|nr:hypothetical protein HPB47_016697 [Ixodes persulcatus]